MVSLVQLWLPILLGAVGVFVASAIIHMFLGFWHNPDYHGFSNADDVAAAMRKGNPSPGIYMVPHCKPEDMKKPEVQEKFKKGPLVFMFLRAGAPMAMGKSLIQWFVFCLVVSLFAGYVAGATLGTGTAGIQVFRVSATAAFMAFGFSSVPSGIWWGQPWGPVFKDMVDGLIYGLIIGAVFACLWPHAMAA
jgi:hypothetical protein